MLAQNALNSDVLTFSTWTHFPLSPAIWKTGSITSGNQCFLLYRPGLRSGEWEMQAGWPGADPLVTGALSKRPLLLDRPFRMPLNLAMYFATIPWKSLNFISSNSADAALLDLFTVGPVPATKLPPRLLPSEGSTSMPHRRPHSRPDCRYGERLSASCACRGECRDLDER